MEARSTAVAVSLSALLTLAGCPMLTAKPAPRPEPPAEKLPLEESVVVVANPTDDSVQPAADTEPDVGEVKRWIQQIERRDDLYTRVEGRPPEEPFILEQDDTYGRPTRPPAGPSADPSETVAEQPASPAPQDAAPGEPPGVESVSARAATDGRLHSASADDTAPSVNAPASAANAPITLQEFVEQWLQQPADASLRNQFDRRLLLVLAGEYEQARQPLEMVSSEQQQMVAHFVETLIAIRAAHGGNPGEEANRVLTQLEQLQDSLIPLSELSIPKLALTRAVRGYGRYEAFDPAHFPAGRENELVVYCEVANFVSRPTDAGRHESQFAMRTTVLNRSGDVVLELNDEHITDECRARRHDCFIPRLIRLPATLSPGEYVVKVTVIDRIGEKVAESRTTFRIVARS
jgi:hypothetical protein